MRQKVNLGIVLTVASVITYFSIRPVPGPVGSAVDFSVLHLIAYFLLAGALLVYFHDTGKGHLEAILLASALGLGIELLQSQVSYRTYDTTDVLTNIGGSSLVSLDHRSTAISKIISMEDRLLERFLHDFF